MSVCTEDHCVSCGRKIERAASGYPDHHCKPAILKFGRLKELAEEKECILERQNQIIDGELYRYTVYDNKSCTEHEAKNLQEVQEILLWDC